MATEEKHNVYVIGHRTPDTDSVCSAIGYAHFKNLTDKTRHFIPARAGALNEETTFALERFGVPAPVLIDSLAATVSDMPLMRPISVNENESIHALAELMREREIRTMPVVNANRRVCGIVGLRDIARHYMESVGLADLSNAPIELDMLIKTLDARLISNTGGVRFLSGRIHIASMNKATVLNRVTAGDIVIIGDQHDIQLDLIAAGCQALIVTDGVPVSADVTSAAMSKGVALLSSAHNAFATVQLILMSEPVSSIMCGNAVTVGLFTPITTLRKKILESDYRSVIVTDGDGRIIGFVTRTDLLKPVRKRAILVDHNEISHAVDSIDEVEILEIIDHHRVGDISTAAPIYVYNDPVGSTCTVVAGMMVLHQINIPPEIAGLLLSGILSDTLLLTLSTTTERDRLLTERLAAIAGVNIRNYGREVLHASINIEGKTTAQLISADFREVLIAGKRLGISQMMVLDCEMINVREDELIEELERLRKDGNYDLTVLLVTNPLVATYERVLLCGEVWMVEKAFGVSVKNNTCMLPGVLSRKRDFIPALAQVLGAETS